MTNPIPSHYDFPVTPWDLQKHMRSTGNLFVDARRTDAIEYAFRLKDDPEGDLRKAAHCLLAAANHLALQTAPTPCPQPQSQQTSGQPFANKH